MLDDITIGKAARLLGLPKSNVKSFLASDIEKGSTINDILQNIENIMMIPITQRINLEEVYQSFVNENLANIINVQSMVNETYTEEEMSKAWTDACKKAKPEFIQYIQNNDKFTKIHYIGKNITSRCSKLPHTPHFDKQEKTFCCGVCGDIELLDYTIKIITVVDKIRGNKSRRSAMVGGYKLQIINNYKGEII